MSRILLALAAACAVLAPPAAAQGFPSRNVTLVVPFAPGGGHDFSARVIAERLGARLGQPVIVENRAGANGMIGAEYVARSAPDGHTLVYASPAEIVINQSVYKHMKYDPLAELAPVTLAGVTPLVVAAHPSLPVKTFAELIAYAKKNPGKLSFGTAGTGSSHHLAGAWINSLAGIDLAHVPYKGAGPAVNDLLGAQIPLVIVGMAPLIGHIKSGKLNALAVTTPRRVSWFDAVPAVAETPGMKDFTVAHWMGILAPAKTPAATIERLNRELVAVLHTPEVKSRLLQQGVEPVGNTPQEFAKFLAEEHERFARLVKISGARIE